MAKRIEKHNFFVFVFCFSCFLFLFFPSPFGSLIFTLVEAAKTREGYVKWNENERVDKKMGREKEGKRRETTGKAPRGSNWNQENDFRYVTLVDER